MWEFCSNRTHLRPWLDPVSFLLFLQLLFISSIEIEIKTFKENKRRKNNIKVEFTYFSFELA